MLNKQEVIEAMQAGSKVRHKYFTHDEWMWQPYEGCYEFEDGIQCSTREFWKTREGLGFEDGWEIVVCGNG